MVRATGGSVSADGDSLVIEGADEAVVLFTAKTDYNVTRLNFDRTIDTAARSDAIQAKVAGKSWQQLLDDHVADLAREPAASVEDASVEDDARASDVDKGVRRAQVDGHVLAGETQ